MPDTYGKRQREGVKARKAAAREERRLQRNRRRAARAGGEGQAEDEWLADPEPGPDEPPADQHEPERPEDRGGDAAS